MTTQPSWLYNTNSSHIRLTLSLLISNPTHLSSDLKKQQPVLLGTGVPVPHPTAAKGPRGRKKGLTPSAPFPAKRQPRTGSQGCRVSPPLGGDSRGNFSVCSQPGPLALHLIKPSF